MKGLKIKKEIKIDLFL